MYTQLSKIVTRISSKNGQKICEAFGVNTETVKTRSSLSVGLHADVIAGMVTCMYVCGEGSKDKPRTFIQVFQEIGSFA
jgi:hypothetical protein